MDIPNRSRTPSFTIIEKVDFLEPQTAELQNGIPIFMQRGGSQEITRFELVFKSGSYHQRKTLQAYVVANLLKGGTREKTAAQINQLWDFYGASLQIDAQKDIISVGFVSLNRHFEDALALLLEMIITPVFPEAELSILMENKKQQHTVNNQKVQHIARVNFSEMLYGSFHPYGKKLQLADFDQLTRKDLVSYHQRFFHPGNCVCFMTGNFDPSVVDTINKAFSIHKWDCQKNDVHPVILPAPAHEQKVYMQKDDAVQSALRLGKIIVNRDHPDHHMVSVTNALLGGYFGSRLMRNIRQEKGYTYGIHSAVINLLRSAYFFISSQVGKEVKALALEEVYKELKKLREVPASDEEVAMLRNYLAAGFLRSFDGPFLQAERFKEIFLFGQGYDWFENYMHTLKTFTARDIQITAEKYFREDQMLELVVG